THEVIIRWTGVIDSHCHLDVEAFDADREAVITRATAAGVTGILVPAIRPRTWSRVIALARPGVGIALGVHPQIVPELEADELDDLEDQIARAVVERGAVASGECGLDGGTARAELQEQILRAHVR